MILEDFYRKLVKGGLAEIISGRIYLKKRPANSMLEDCVVSLLSGIDGQFQRGAITCNVYVQNIAYPDNAGFLGEDYIRTQAISDKLAEILYNYSLMDDGEYKFRLNNIISTYELEAANAHQHFVHAEINFIKTIYYES
jgi:hypothetical protein